VKYSNWKPGLHYDASFVSAPQRAEILRWLSRLTPLWERRYSVHHPAPEGKAPRALLRPVYWLGNWQFACLGYYHPPKGTRFRCVQAEPFPPVLQAMVKKIEYWVRTRFPAAYVPPGWHLNTCLVNLYGMREMDGKRVDTARVGEHKDFEPGPVASISLGERAMFQFVASRGRGDVSRVVLQQWLEDGSLQIFGGDRWKSQLFHRVQRVDRKGGFSFPVSVVGFQTRRVNFTFRFVPPRDIAPYSALPEGDAQDVKEYMEVLAQRSDFFKRALAARKGKA
jgi:alkylated DNA repair dioxygenase AlkB